MQRDKERQSEIILSIIGIIPVANKFPKNTKLYKLMTTKPGEV